VTRETPRKLSPPRGVPGPAVSAPRGRSRRYERPFDRSCLTVRPRPCDEVFFRPVPARKPFPWAPCGTDSTPFGGCPVERSRPPFGLRADPFESDVSGPVSLPGDTREGRAIEHVRLPKTLMGFRDRRRRFAIRDTRSETRDKNQESRTKTRDTRLETRDCGAGGLRLPHRQGGGDATDRRSGAEGRPGGQNRDDELRCAQA
jgi:hypothetical protein